MGMASLRRDGFTSVEAVMTGEPGAYSPQLSAVPTIMFLSMILSKRRVYPYKLRTDSSTKRLELITNLPLVRRADDPHPDLEPRSALPVRQYCHSTWGILAGGCAGRCQRGTIGRAGVERVAGWR